MPATATITRRPTMREIARAARTVRFTPAAPGRTITAGPVTVTADPARFSLCAAWVRDRDDLTEGVALWSEVFGDGFDGAGNQAAAIEAAARNADEAFAALTSCPI